MMCMLNMSEELKIINSFSFLNVPYERRLFFVHFVFCFFLALGILIEINKA